MNFVNVKALFQNDVDINEIGLSNNLSFSKKRF